MNITESTPPTDGLSFSSLALREALYSNIASLGYTTMTPIQAQSLPIMLKGQDVMAQAKTGSGKTAAFGLTLLNRLDLDKYAVQALVLCPTRELAEQTSQALRQLARLMPNIKVLNLSGGMPIKAQSDSLRHGAHIIVGTPGRVLKHMDRESLSLHAVSTLILDEADRCLDMGFFDAINDIITRCPQPRQTLLLSATFPAGIKKLAGKFMRNPKRIIIEETHTAFEIEQVFYALDQPKNKFQALKTLLLHHTPQSTLIFCNTKEQTIHLTASLIKEGFSAAALNGDMEQAERDIAIIQFKNQSCAILVATDVAARGLDIKELPAVINFDLAFEHDTHIHRIGRTGRAGLQGFAISLTTPADAQRLCAIEDGLGQPVTWGNLGTLTPSEKTNLKPEMITLSLAAGRKDKMRPGDILGALTKEAGLAAALIGKIDITPLYSYVALHRSVLETAFQYLRTGKLKGRRINVKKLS